MSTFPRSLKILACFVSMTCANLAQADFFDRGGGMIYDDVLDITWLKDANHAMSSGYDDDGLMTWVAASAWAESLTVGTHEDWRLPTFDPFNARPDVPTLSNEIGSLWSQLNGGANIGADTDISPFINLPYQSELSEWYWTGLEGSYSDPSDVSVAWRFSVNCACWDSQPKGAEFYAWAVRSGDAAESLTIDIKPGKTPNSINPTSGQMIPVAILTTASFDALAVFYALEADPLSVEFGPDGATESHGRGHVKDVDGDGDTDLVLHFNTQDAGIACGDIEATLTGMTFDGQAITGTDTIQTVNCR